MKILDCSRHTIPWSAFADGVAHSQVLPIAVRELAFPSNDSLAFVIQPKFRGNRVGLVIHISPPIRPLDVVEEDHSSTIQQAPLNQAQLIEHGKPVVISIDKDAIVSPGKFRECIEAVTPLDLDPCVARVFGRKFGIEAAVNDRIRGEWQLEKLIRGETSAGADFANRLPA